jgi:hypothetical protein
VPYEPLVQSNPAFMGFVGCLLGAEMQCCMSTASGSLVLRDASAD